MHDLTKLQEDLDAAKEVAVSENTAQDILKHLDKLEKDPESFSARWIWELLQNASDAAPLDQGVNVKLDVHPQELRFQHDGDPFSYKEISHLIYHGSTKQEDPSKSGEFGSGFLCTHLISREVRIRGILKGEYCFDFTLSREGDSAEELGRRIKDSFMQFKESCDVISAQQERITEYIYPLDRRGNVFTQVGIKSLRSHIIYVLAFNKKLKVISINNNGQEVNIRKGTSIRINEKISVMPIECEPRSTDQIGVHVALIEEDDLCVGVKLVEDNDQYTVELDESTPRIHVSFPLIGTEDFCFPGVVHSLKFKPKEERDGIHLKKSLDDAVLRNKELMVRASGLLLELLETGSEIGWCKVHKMAFLPQLDKGKGWYDPEWYQQDILEPFLRTIRKSRILVNNNKEMITPENSLIPVLPSGSLNALSLWDLAEKLPGNNNSFPQREDAIDWAKIVKSWGPYAGMKLPLQEEYDLSRFARQIAELRSIKQLEESLTNVSDCMSWLNKAIDLIVKESGIQLLDKIRILPDQNGDFRELKELDRDEGIDEELKNIADDLGCGVKSTLLHTRIRNPEIYDSRKKRTEKNVLEDAIRKIKERAKEDPSDETFYKVNVSLFWWVVKHNELDELQDYPVITKEVEDDEYRISSLSKNMEEGNLPLAPPDCWPGSAGKFHDLFPNRFILSEYYSEVCPNRELWETIANDGYIRISPIYTAKPVIITFTDDEVSSDDRDDHKSQKSLERSSIAFLSKTTPSIISNVSGKRTKSIQFLRFILESVVHLDEKAFELREAECSCNAQHKYYCAEWLNTIKNKRWVYHNRKRFRPSAESLAYLLAGDQYLVELLRDEKSIQFMEIIGVSMPDLKLRALSDDEDDRDKLVDDLALMLEASGNDPEKVHILAKETRDCPDFLDMVKERRDRRDQVQRNNAIGTEVESLLKECLESKGFIVNRTGIGSDFEIESATEIEPSFHFELMKGDSSFLIEVKSTKGSAVRMSELQTKAAVNEKDRFVLCVVQLAATEPTKSDILQRARFVTDISNSLGEPWQAYSRLKGTRDETETRYGNIELDIDKAGVRFKIDEAAWASSLTFEDAIEFFLSVSGSLEHS